MTYLDIMVAAVPDLNREAYRLHAEKMARIFKEYGATSIKECWGDDVPDGKLTSFPLAVQKAAGESVVVAFIEWPTRQARDEAWKKMMADERMRPAGQIFDGKRMIYGGFQPFVQI